MTADDEVDFDEMSFNHAETGILLLILQANVFPSNTPNSTLTYYFDMRQAISQ